MTKIIIIDDDAVVSHIYQSNFRMEGFQTETAADGESGLALIAKAKPDLVLLDLALPDMHGNEVLTRIRANPETKRLPVIVFTNWFQPKIVGEARKAGATKCLRKSECTPKAVAEVVIKVIEDAKSGTDTAVSELTEELSGAPQTLQALRGNFPSQAQEAIGQYRRLLQDMAKEEDTTRRTVILKELHGAIPHLAGSAAVCGYREIAQFISAMQALVEELHNRPKCITPSTTNTLAQAIDFLDDFIGHWLSSPDDTTDLPPNILVVDDDRTSREMVTFALAKVGLNSINLEFPKLALEVLETNQFDLIFLDVNMPEMSGFELCQKIRKHPTNGNTPVVFVTVASDFTNRTRSTLSGGTDLIAKPFLMVELAVKAFIHLFGQKINASSKAPAQKAA